MRKLKNLLCALMAVMLMLSYVPALAEADTSETVNISMYLYGSEGIANKDILAKINEKLMADLNCTLEIRYIDWGETSTKYPLLFLSGESFDLAYGSATGIVPLADLATQGSILEITDDMLALVPALRDAITDTNWAGVTVDGKKYGIPCVYSEFTPYGFAYRTDMLEKYNLQPITSLETMEAYLTAVTAEPFPPINDNSSGANSLYRMFTDLTGDWIYAPGIVNGSVYLVATEDDPANIISPVFTQEFADWCAKMKTWNDAGYFAADALAATTGAKDNTNNGLSSGYVTHMPDWTGCYGTLIRNLPGVQVDWWSPAVDAGKVINKPGADNSTVISATSKNPERALMVVEKLMFDEEYYRLFQYGIQGRQYDIVDGVSVTPENYDSAVDGGGFSGWALRNDDLNIPYATEDPRRYELIEAWKQTCIESPYVGFNLNTENITNELAAISDVNNTLGTQLLLGKTVEDVDTALKNYRAQLEMAGIQTVIDEVKTQVEAYLATK